MLNLYTGLVCASQGVTGLYREKTLQTLLQPIISSFESCRIQPLLKLVKQCKSFVASARLALHALSLERPLLPRELSLGRQDLEGSGHECQ